MSDDILDNLWGKRDRGVPLPEIDWNRPASHDDVLFLLRKFPYIQMINTEPTLDEEYELTFITAQNGWVIHDYGDAMSVSPGKHLYGFKPEAEDEEEGGEGGAALDAGKGTTIKQAVDTAAEMIAIAMDQKVWAGAEIIDGTDLMKWAAWVAAEERGFTLEGFEPTEEDKAKQKRVRALLEEAGESPTFGNV